MKREKHTVSTNTQVNLLLERVGLEGFGDTQDSVLPPVLSAIAPQTNDPNHN